MVFIIYMLKNNKTLKMNSLLERYRQEYEKVKNIRHWSDSYIAPCFCDGKISNYLTGFLDNSSYSEYYYEPNKILFKKEFYFKENIFKIRYYDDKGNITKVEKTEYYKSEYESLDCLHLPFDSYDLIMLSVGKSYQNKESFEREYKKIEKENEEEKRYLEGLNK